MLKFQRHYFILAVIIFLIELLIALFIHDGIIRPYIGDFLVVILIYWFIKAFFNIPVWTTVIIVLLFSYTVEWLQYLNIVEKLGLQDIKLARMIIGTSFGWMDLVMYTFGICFVLIVEKRLRCKGWLSEN